MAYINTCVAFLCFVCVLPSRFFLLVCFSCCLRHFKFLFHFIFFPFSLLISCFHFFLSIHSLFSRIYEHTYFTFSYLVCTHLPLIYFTNKAILFGDFAVSGIQIQQFFAYSFQNEKETFSFLSLL